MQTTSAYARRVNRLEKKLEEQDKKLDEKDKMLEEQYKKLDEKDKMLEEKDMKIIRLEQLQTTEDSAWESREGKDRHSSGKAVPLLHAKERICNIISNPKRLYNVTSCSQDQLEWLSKRFIKQIPQCSNAPLFSEDSSTNPGNRCLLDKKEVLLLELVHMRLGISQAAIAALFEIDQSTVSRYLAFSKDVLLDILPTTKKVAARIKKAQTIQEFEELVPESTIIVDGTEVPRQRPSTNDIRKRTYSGKKKRHTLKTTITSNKDGLIIDMGRAFEGSTHDITMLRKDPVDLGRWSESMKTGRGNKLKVLADKGYQGITRYFPGIILEQPEKKPKGKELDPEQEQSNLDINRRRMTVEHTIGRIKKWEIMQGPYDGTMQDFERDAMVVTGLVNMQLLWDRGKKRPRIEF